MPEQVKTKLRAWATTIETDGLPVAQTYPGYNDEKLAGTREGQHSFRLSLAYRGFYTVGADGASTARFKSSRSSR